MPQIAAVVADTTLPTDGFAISSVSMDAARRVTLTWPTSPGFTYAVWASTDPTDLTLWKEVVDALTTGSYTVSRRQPQHRHGKPDLLPDPRLRSSLIPGTDDAACPRDPWVAGQPEAGSSFRKHSLPSDGIHPMLASGHVREPVPRRT